MKKKSILLLMVLCIMCSFTVVAFATEMPKIKIESTMGELGEKVIIPIKIENNCGVTSIGIIVEYDTSVLTLKSVKYTDLIPGAMYNNNHDSPYYLTWINDLSKNNFSASGTLANLEFIISDTAPLGEYEIKVKTQTDGILNANGDALDFQFINGTIDVAEKKCSHLWNTWEKNNRFNHIKNCKKCDSIMTELHSWDNEEILTPPTEKSVGTSLYTCSVCFGTKTVILPALVEKYAVSVIDSYATISGEGQYETGDTVTLNSGTREGYLFNGWFSADVDITEETGVASFIMPDHDVTVTANWTKNSEDDTDTPTIPITPIRPSTPSKPSTTVPTNPSTITVTPEYTCPYTDISDHWANEIIQYIDKLGLIDGNSDGLFNPDKPMTREMFVTAMARLGGVESNYINWAIEIGLLKGYGNGEYGLQDTVTREQMAVFFLRFLELMGIDYDTYKTVDRYNFADDNQIADWAKEAVYEMQGLDLIHGKGNGIFDPKGLTTRAEGAAVLYNMCNTVLNK